MNYVDTSKNNICEQPFGCGHIAGVTGVILAGGASRRMGMNKSFLKIGERLFIERVYSIMAMLFRDIIMVTNTPELYEFISCRTVADIYSGAGPIAGLHAGLRASCTDRIFAAACDMPFLNAALIRLICQNFEGYDAVVPLNCSGFREPLHALYAKSALNAMQQVIELGDKSIMNLLDRLKTKQIANDTFHSIHGADESFRNLNTPEEFSEVTKLMRGVQPECDSAPFKPCPE
ncbi:MAG: molybdenum cofactor guanylyltransferase [Proteobacteria bacterium]|nr:molybdenum cofactor guanylyltransferase [Pseudomonadota bacterium]